MKKSCFEVRFLNDRTHFLNIEYDREELAAMRRWFPTLWFHQT